MGGGEKRLDLRDLSPSLSLKRRGINGGGAEGKKKGIELETCGECNGPFNGLLLDAERLLGTLNRGGGRRGCCRLPVLAVAAAAPARLLSLGAGSTALGTGRKGGRKAARKAASVTEQNPGLPLCWLFNFFQCVLTPWNWLSTTRK